MAVDRLKMDYFNRDPNFIVDIWLFKNKESYEKHTVQLFGSKPHTPFGLLFFAPSFVGDEHFARAGGR